MKSINLKAMSFDALIDLRDTAENLVRKRAKSEARALQERLARLTGFVGSFLPSRGKSLKGRKVAPKYRNPANRSETWAGRGVRPRWLQAYLRDGRKLEEFAIARGRAKSARKRVARRGRRKKA